MIDQRKTRIFIVDDHPLVREGLTSRIAAHSELEICGEASTSEEALQLLQSTPADLALIDIMLKEGHGLELVKQLRELFPQLRMLVISAFDEFLYAERALRAGAHGYINKQECQENVIEAIHTILAGKRYISPNMTDRLVGMRVDGAETSAGTSYVAKLSDRELEVFQLIGKGLSTGMIAKQLHLSPHTIDSHREKIKLKLNLKSGAEMTQRAVQWSLESH